MLLSMVKTASECGVDMHGLISSWSFMDVVVARASPGLATDWSHHSGHDQPWIVTMNY